MATVAHGSIGPFDSSEEDWETYVERVELYLAANKIDDAQQKRDVLLSVCGSKTYHTLRDLLAPAKPRETSYADVVKTLKTHFNPKQGVAVHRFKFNSRTRGQGESIAKYVAALRHLAIDCEYGDTLNVMLRDRLICGVNDPRIQRRLLSEVDVDFDSALKTALAMEMADRDAGELTGMGAGDKVISDNHKEGEVHKAGPQHNKRSSCQNCFRCGGHHKAAVCRHKETECHHCGKKGHLRRVCRSRLQGKPQKTLPVKAEPQDDDEAPLYTMFPLRSNKYDPIYLTVTVNNTPLRMEVDTGATLSVISEATYQKTWGTEKPALTQAKARLTTYTGEKIPLRGMVRVMVQHRGQRKELSLIVTEGSGPSLLGRNWITELQLDWKATYHVKESSALATILESHRSVFADELGTITCAKAEIHMDPQVPPSFYRPRPVPFALKGKVEEELERLQREGIIQPRQSSQWATPIVAVPKSDGTVRICGDYKVTANKAMICDTHPIPRSEDIFAAMSGGMSFSKLDLSHAYLQLQVADSTREYLVINTHKGLFEYSRMPFGITSAPAIFQRTMDNLLQGLDHVTVYIDDILITGKSDEEHLRTLDEVLSRLEGAGMRLKKEKCTFMAEEVIYLGHRINQSGIQPTDDKIRTIDATPKPTNISELRAFLGLVNFYGKFLNNLSIILAPLYELLRKGVTWKWERAQNEAFESAKNLLKSPQLLVHYDPAKELILTCDASPYGVGAVLAHRMEDGLERPIEYASRTLAPAEKNYAQIDKEALAIVFGVKRFHRYLYGRSFTIYSDHKPLMYIFGEHRGISQTASARIQRWALTLMGYQYNIVHRPGGKLGNADGLSRLPVPVAVTDPPQPPDTILLMERLNSSLVTAAQIRSSTGRDPCLSKVRKRVLEGWTGTDDDEMKPYASRKDELSIEDGCVLWGTRVIVPPQLRSQVIEEVHEGHPGIAKMKSFARGYIWWPSLDKALEDRVRSCLICQETQKMPPRASFHPWKWPEKPWSRIHIDHAGPVLGKTLLVIVDAHSKWIDAQIVSSTSTAATIEKLRSTFATHGLPNTIVSDNGPAFTSVEFQEFLKRNGVEHLRSTPYHPSSNGLAERAVQTIKRGVKKLTGTLEVRLARFLFKYRVTPQTTTGIAPAELLMGRRLRTHLDLLYPTMRERIQRRQREQKGEEGKRRVSFKPGDRVMGRNFSSGPSWLPGTIIECEGESAVKIKLDDGRNWRRHVDHVRTTQIPYGTENTKTIPSDRDDPLTAPAEQVSTETDRETNEQPNEQRTEPNIEQETFGQPQVELQEPERLRRSTRDRHPPDRYV